MDSYHFTTPEERAMARLLNPKERKDYLQLYATGMTRNQCCKALGVHPASDALTAHAYPDFKEQWEKIKDARKKQIELKLITLAIGAAQQVKEYWVTVKDEEG